MANIWSIRVVVNLVIFSQIFFSLSNLKVLALTNVGKQQCIGKHQFGVDVFHEFLESEMQMKFNDFEKIPTESTMENNGHVLKIELNYNGTVPTIEINFRRSVGVVGTFRFKFLYFQWFKKARNALHYKNVSFPAQLHAVFYDVNARNYDHAVTLRSRVIVLAFTIVVHPVNNSFIFLMDDLKYVRQSNSKAPIGNVDLYNWLKSMTSQFWVHEGSFFEFPCQGTVVWIDFRHTLSITPETVEEFQKLKANEVNPLMGEVRETTKPKGMLFFNELGIDKAKKNNIEMPDYLSNLHDELSLSLIQSLLKQ